MARVFSDVLQARLRSLKPGDRTDFFFGDRKTYDVEVEETGHDYMVLRHTMKTRRRSKGKRRKTVTEVHQLAVNLQEEGLTAFAWWERVPRK